MKNNLVTKNKKKVWDFLERDVYWRNGIGKFMYFLILHFMFFI